MENAHAKSADELLRFFGTGPDGLTEQQVTELREKYGPNGKFILFFSSLTGIFRWDREE